MTTSTEFFKKEAASVVRELRENLSETCDKIYRGDRYRRQWGYQSIMKEVCAIMRLEEQEIDFHELELKKREDNMWHYLQAERCPACNKTNCRIHCNYTGCGEPIDWSHDGYGYFGADGKQYPMNPDTSPHLLCHVWRTRERKYYLEQVKELIHEKGIEWRRKSRSEN